MMEFRKLRIKTKLIVVALLTSSIGITCAGVGILSVDRIEHKEVLAEEMSTLLKVIASRSAAALSFQDHSRAIDNLESLLVKESVILTCLYDSNNQIFAEVTRESALTEPCPDEPRHAGEYFLNSHLEAYRKIQLNGVDIGTLMVGTSLIDLDRRLKNQVLLSAIIMVFSLLFAFLLTFRMQRAIYRPIIDLGELARKITALNDFSLRTSTSNEDEIGETLAAINAMQNKIDSDKEELTRLAYYDPLTKLANRRMFNERLVFALENARRSGDKMGLIFVDLNKFKEVNDELGQDDGDQMLKAVAIRIESTLPANATAFRFGGDEFTILQVGVAEPELEVTAQRILTAFSDPLILAGRQLAVSLSIGIASSDGEHNASSILRNADTALSEAKGEGRSIYRIYVGS